MQVPLNVFAAFFSIHPGKRWPELGDEIIAPRLVAIPPAAGDALGTGDELEPAFLHRDRPFEQPGRARTRLHELVRIPFARLDAAPGIFRPMVGMERDAMYCIAPQAGLQAPEQPRPVPRLGARL